MPWWEDGDQQPPWMAQQAQQPAQQTAQPAQQFDAYGGMLAAYQPQAAAPTPMPKPELSSAQPAGQPPQFDAFGGILAAYQSQAGDAGSPTPMPKPALSGNPGAAQTAQGAVGGDAYAMGVNATFNKDYKTPDWYKASGFMVDSSPEAMAAYLPQPEHYGTGRTSLPVGYRKFSTDGTSLIKTDCPRCRRGRCAIRAEPYELLARRRFNQDPTRVRELLPGPGLGGFKPVHHQCRST